MGATFSRLKNWIAEILTYADLNAEIDNILTNLTPSGADDYSSSATQMRLSVDPGEAGTESLATSLAGELERIRFVLKELKGGDIDYWYESIPTSLSDIQNLLGTDQTNNRLVSGAHSASSSAARFLVPAVSSNSFTLDASPTAFVYLIDGAQYTISTDVVTSSLGTAPTSSNTALINDTALTAQESSKVIGEDGLIMTIDTAGTEITSRTNQLCGFKITHSGNTEYFIGFVKSATQITNCLRGYFYGASSAAIPRIAIADNDPITLMRLTWIYANTAGAVTLSYTNPTYSYTQPSSPATGDYWYDMGNGTWKLYDSVAFVAANAILIGVTIQDATNCVAARPFEYYFSGDTYSSMDIEYLAATTLQQKYLGGKLTVGGTQLKFETTRPIWDITAHIEAGYTEQASTTYYAYMSESGQLVLSPRSPYYNNGITKGYYHPSEIWRAVGKIQNNSSSDFDSTTLVSYAIPTVLDAANDLKNISLSVSVAANALTINLKTKAGTNANPVDFIQANFINASAAGTSEYITRKVTAPLTVTVPSTATLGHTSAVAQYVWVYLVDDAGVIDLAVSGVNVFDDTSTQSMTIVSAAATSGTVLYSGVTHTGAKSIRLIGRILITEATAGTWATAPTSVVCNVCPVYAATDWTDGGTVSIGATTSAPTKASGITTDKIFYRRDGRDLIARYTLAQSNNASAAAGSGDYKFALPASLTAATTNYTLYTTVVGNAAAPHATNKIGTGSVGQSGSTAEVHLSLYDSTTFRAFGTNAAAISGALCSASNANLAGTAPVIYCFDIRVEIAGWSKYGPL